MIVCDAVRVCACVCACVCVCACMISKMGYCYVCVCAWMICEMGYRYCRSANKYTYEYMIGRMYEWMNG